MHFREGQFADQASERHGYRYAYFIWAQALVGRYTLTEAVLTELNHCD